MNILDENPVHIIRFKANFYNDGENYAIISMKLPNVRNQYRPYVLEIEILAKIKY